MTYDKILNLEPFAVRRAEKRRLMTAGLLELTRHHQQECAPYRRMLDTIGYQESAVGELEDVPFLPVRLFKELELKSVPREDVFKVMTSSGTSGQRYRVFSLTARQRAISRRRWCAFLRA